MERSRLLLVLLTLVFAIEGEAWAQESEAPEDSPPQPESDEGEQGRSEAQPAAEQDPGLALSVRHFEAGIDLVERELWEAAAAEFRESLASHHNSSALFNLALCLQRLLRYQDALDVLEEYLERYGDSDPAQRAPVVRRTMRELRSLVTEVRLDIEPHGATVVIGSRVVGTSPLERPLLLHSGQHQLEIRLEGYETYRDDLMVVVGRPVHRRITLGLVPDTGLLRIRATPAHAQLSIDGEDVGRSPYEGHLRPGVHLIDVTAGGYRTESETVTLDEGGLREVDMELHRNRLPRAPFWALLSTSIVGFLSTTILGAVTLVFDANYDRFDDETYRFYENGRPLMIAADVSLGITLSASLASLVIGIFTDWSHASSEQEEAISMM